MAKGDVQVNIRMTQKQAGKMYMKNIELEKQVTQLRELLSHAVYKLSRPVNEIRDGDFSDFMTELRAAL